jgi:hypothetical protein
VTVILEPVSSFFLAFLIQFGLTFKMQIIMRNIFTLFITLLLSLSAAFAQPLIPDGYVSVYSIKPETEMAPLTIAGVTSSQLLGPAIGWGASTEYNFSNYEKLSFKITYDAADAGHQMAIRMSVNTSVKLHLFTLPTSGTTVTEEINLLDFANADGKILVGGIVFYNGASHFSFAYNGTPASKSCTIEYVAIKINPDIFIHNIPDGYVSVYSIKPETGATPLKMNAGSSYQLLGSANSWGSSLEYDFSNYEKLAVQIAFDPADTAKQVAFRFSINGYTYLHLFTLPNEGKVNMEEINLADYADTDGKVLAGGIVFYNGATHWSFTYTNPAIKAATIDFVALKPKSTTGLNEISVKDNDPDVLVDVYSIMGILIRKNVKYSEATIRLKPGLYIIGHKKVYVTQ